MDNPRGTQLLVFQHYRGGRVQYMMGQLDHGPAQEVAGRATMQLTVFGQCI